MGYSPGSRMIRPPKTQTQRIWDRWITIFGFKIPVHYRKKKITPGSREVPEGSFTCRDIKKEQLPMDGASVFGRAIDRLPDISTRRAYSGLWNNYLASVTPAPSLAVHYKEGPQTTVLLGPL
jgi:hypothetical protein